MKRTQIYFDEKTYNYLRKESKTKHVSISEVIRESIRDKKSRKVQKVLKAVDDVCGIWKDRKIDAGKYVRSIRTDRELW